MTMDEHDRAALATSVDVVLALLKGAERRTSFPAPGEDASHCDAENEESKRREIASERTYFEELRARIDPMRAQTLGLADSRPRPFLPSPPRASVRPACCAARGCCRASLAGRLGATAAGAGGGACCGMTRVESSLPAYKLEDEPRGDEGALGVARVLGIAVVGCSSVMASPSSSGRPKS